MRFLKIIIAILFIFLTTKIALAYQFSQQIDEITSNPKNASRCTPLSIKKFSYSDRMEKNYLYNICKLSPDIKSFAFFYDVDNNKIANQILLPISFESLQIASPKYCDERKDGDTIMQNCNVFISSGLSGMNGKELMFSSPWTPVTNPKTIEEYLELMPK